ncbi:MAG TPA: sigma-70 family RNA polymerase sigma factor, partial [Candidatus Limnocylindria bacterium]|nr:sigma-70 family RNA polymerase sigma factor [Candidatus Limnocylindria bacterium]
MSMEDDATILKQFTQDGSESAFGELVRRHVDAVYSTALRLSNGQTGLAEDITQGVFTDFARKAHTFPPGTLLGGWLYRATRNTAAATLRSERRRAAREKEAIMLQETNRPEDSASWENIRPLLDDSLDALKESDRDALLLRYFQQRSLREIGSALGVSEDAARMRIDRALERLKSLLAAKGVPSTAAALGMILETQVVGSAPVAFVQTLSATAIGAAALAPVSTLSLVTLMSTTTTKIAIPILVAACLSIPLIQQHRTVNRLLGENARLQAASQVPTHGNTESHPVVDDSNDLQLELARLRGEVAGKRELEKELSKLKEDAKRRAPV